MYYYIYDSFLDKRGYDRTLAKIETRLTDLGINGKIGRLSILRNINELIENGVKKRAKTIVIVGNDKIISRAIHTIAIQNVTLGIIPIGNETENKIARLLGIPPEEHACEILSRRMIKKIDLGRINGSYFLSLVQFRSNKLTIECDKKFNIISLNKNNYINIHNLDCLTLKRPQLRLFVSNPEDGFLDAIIWPKLNIISKLLRRSYSYESIVPIKKIIVRDDKKIPILVDNHKIIKTPAVIEVVPKKLKIIVGKERLF